MHKKGFTLVELLIVLGIIGILSAVIIGSTNISRAKARDARRIGDLKEIQISLALYYDVNKNYPASLATLAANDQRFMSRVPVDPLTGGAYPYITLANKHYCLGTTLESDIPSDNNSCDPGAAANYKVSR